MFLSFFNVSCLVWLNKACFQFLVHLCSNKEYMHHLLVLPKNIDSTIVFIVFFVLKAVMYFLQTNKSYNLCLKKLFLQNKLMFFSITITVDLCIFYISPHFILPKSIHLSNNLNLYLKKKSSELRKTSTLNIT